MTEPVCDFYCGKILTGLLVVPVYLIPHPVSLLK